eukprot:scaffold878_cov271-Pinguiococcus_pyrenoidosus.AAC.28
MGCHAHHKAAVRLADASLFQTQVRRRPGLLHKTEILLNFCVPFPPSRHASSHALALQRVLHRRLLLEVVATLEQGYHTGALALREKVVVVAVDAVKPGAHDEEIRAEAPQPRQQATGHSLSKLGACPPLLLQSLHGGEAASRSEIAGSCLPGGERDIADVGPQLFVVVLGAATAGVEGVAMTEIDRPEEDAIRVSLVEPGLVHVLVRRRPAGRQRQADPPRSQGLDTSLGAISWRSVQV